MDIPGIFQPPEKDILRYKRRERRYNKIAAALLPKWAPDALVRTLSRHLAFSALPRGSVLVEAKDHPDCRNPICPHCQPKAYFRNQYEVKRARLIRLATYPDMDKAWSAIIASELKGPSSQNPNLREDLSAQHIYGSITLEIDRAIESLDRLPTRSAAQKKAGARKLAKLARELVEAIESDEDARTLGRSFLENYIGIRHIEFRRDSLKERIRDTDFILPQLSYLWPLSLSPIPTDREKQTTWNDFSPDKKFDWLAHEIESTSIDDLIAAFADRMDAIAEMRPMVSRPGSGDPRIRVLVKALSDWVLRWYGSPLDDAVACFVSAALDLREPLTRDDIRPLRKRNAGA